MRREKRSGRRVLRVGRGVSGNFVASIKGCRRAVMMGGCEVL